MESMAINLAIFVVVAVALTAGHGR